MNFAAGTYHGSEHITRIQVIAFANITQHESIAPKHRYFDIQWKIRNYTNIIGSYNSIRMYFHYFDIKSPYR